MTEATPNGGTGRKTPWYVSLAGVLIVIVIFAAVRGWLKEEERDRPKPTPSAILQKQVQDLLGPETRISPALSNVALVAGTTIALPPPNGFARLRPGTKLLADVERNQLSPLNRLCAYYIDERDLGKALAGEDPDSERAFSAEVLKAIENQTFTSAQFAELKAVFRKEHEEMYQKVERALPGILDKTTGRLNQTYNLDVAINAFNMVGLPPHEEDARSLSNSTFMKMTFQDSSGRTVNHVSVCTGTLLHVKGKILFLYTSGAKDDLEWTRTASKAWVAKLIAANP